VTTHIDVLKMHDYGDQRAFDFPPIHLFWGPSPANQTKFYLHVLELCHELLDRFYLREVCLQGGEWQSILRDTYWKHDAMPKLEDTYQPEIDPEYDLKSPYVHGGTLFFGSVDDEVKSGTRQVKSLMDCGCEPMASMADEEDCRYSVLHWLQNLHIYAELLQVDEEFRKGLSPEEQKNWEEAINFLINKMSCGHN
jgi:hypothetical protein